MPAGGVIRRIVATAAEPASIEMPMVSAGHTNRTRFRNQILRPLLNAGILKMAVPDKPRSSKQKYIICDIGKGER